MEIISIVISVFSLAASVYIGIRQVRIDKKQSDLATKVELYITFAPVRVIRVDIPNANLDATSNNLAGHNNADSSSMPPNSLLPSLMIKNISSGVVYLDKYLFNGREYPLDAEVLPPVTAVDAYHYIFCAN